MKTIDQIIKSHHHICWYPSAGADFRGLLYLNDVYYEWKQIPREPDQKMPDLFIMTDLLPQVYSSYGAGELDGGEIGYTDLKYLRNDEYKKIKDLYSGYRRIPESSTKTNVTQIMASSIERLQDIHLQYNGNHFDSSLIGHKPSYYNRVFFIKAHVMTLHRHKDRAPDKYEYDADLLYVLTDNMYFARDYLVNNNIPVEYVIQVRYGDDRGGGSAVSGTWVKYLLGALHAKFFVANSMYANSNAFPKTDFFSGKLSEANLHKVINLKDPNNIRESANDFDLIDIYRVM